MKPCKGLIIRVCHWCDSAFLDTQIPLILLTDLACHILMLLYNPNVKPPWIVFEIQAVPQWIQMKISGCSQTWLEGAVQICIYVPNIYYSDSDSCIGCPGRCELLARCSVGVYWSRSNDFSQVWLIYTIWKSGLQIYRGSLHCCQVLQLDQRSSFPPSLPPSYVCFWLLFLPFLNLVLRFICTFSVKRLTFPSCIFHLSKR